MAITRFPCPSCNVVLRVADSTPANTLIRCPKCGERFRTPAPAEESDRVITSTEMKTLPRVPRAPATVTEDDKGLLRKIHRPAPRSRTVLWVVLGSLAACLVLALGGVGIGVAIWLRRLSSNPPPPVPPVQFVQPEANAPRPFVPGRAPGPQGNTAMERFLLGNQRVQQGDLDGAIKAFTRAIELNPRFTEAYCNRGLARGQKGDFDGAIADFDKCLALLPTFELGYVHRGHMWSKKKNWDKAEADYSRALKLNPSNLQVYLNRGISRMKQSQRAGAVSDFTAALQLDPRDLLPYYHRAEALCVSGDLQGARADIDRAVILAPGTPFLESLRVKILLCAGDVDGALAAAERLVILQPLSSDALVCRAFIYACRGEQDKALADYAAALNLNARYVTVYLLRGWFYLSLGREDEAAQDADAGLKLAGGKHRHAPYLAILAHCARQRRHPDQARRAVEALSKQGDKRWPQPILKFFHDDMSAEELLRAAADNDERTEAHAYLGVVRWLSGADKKAREHLEWARDNAPRDFIEYDLALWLLRRLDKGPPRKP
ncbi:MAG TPA: tetratricopeptide repeat protein [Rhizomicrobium sp.]|nr:tetratricopeptide repeat protein [Rhizomicrobium sp.]